ncbi:MAG: FHA domain-containing protein [Candidatus Saccharibacteria bacterium]|nr:FHA domain-containing protein [Candidatus Saccharibacteria bacterium]
MKSFEQDPLSSDAVEQVKPFVTDIDQETEARHQQLELHNLGEGALSIDLSTVEPLEMRETSALVAVMDVAGRGVKLWAPAESGRINPNGFLFLGSQEYDPDTKADEDEARPASDAVMPVRENSGEKVYGRAHHAKRLGLEDDHVSRNHFSVSYENGRVNITDLESTNGTSVITNPLETPESQEKEGNFERKIDDVSYELRGAFAVNERERSLVFESTDKEGNSHTFFVYRSNSEGSLRVSQGIESQSQRFVKGPETGSLAQYTQDTQLHPEFRKIVEEASEFYGDHAPYTDPRELFMAHHEAVVSMNEFYEKVGVLGFGNRELNGLLQQVRTGTLGEQDVAEQLGVGAGEAGDALSDYVEKINSELSKEEGVPTFDSPVETYMDSHPHLGQITKEVYEASINGARVHWHMAYDKEGRVWIDRIRSADSRATAYGTDETMMYSGILTTKPLEYNKQTTAIPTRFTSTKASGEYVDISKFLDQFAPIKSFRASRGVERQENNKRKAKL